MIKTVKYTVTLVVDDGGDFDSQYPRDAIMEGLDRANSEGCLSSVDDETTKYFGWVVRHESTTESAAPTKRKRTPIKLAPVKRGRRRAELPHLRG